MANYTKLTNFAAKDTLASGNPLKIIKGTEIDDEFEDIETAILSKADALSPTLTGTPTAPTAAATTNTTQIATCAFVQAQKTAATFTGTTTVQTLAATAVNTSTLSATTSISLGNWVLSLSSNDLLFSYNGTGVFKMTTSGELQAADDLTAFATI